MGLIHEPHMHFWNLCKLYHRNRKTTHSHLLSELHQALSSSFTHCSLNMAQREKRENKSLNVSKYWMVKITTRDVQIFNRHKQNDSADQLLGTRLSYTRDTCPSNNAATSLYSINLPAFFLTHCQLLNSPSDSRTAR